MGNTELKSTLQLAAGYVLPFGRPTVNELAIAVQFWQDHSSNYLEMTFRTDHTGIVEKSDGHGKKTGKCEDTV